MRSPIFIVSCLGLLLVFLSRPAGRALNNWQIRMAGVNVGEWFYRLPFMLIGVLLTLFSFLR